MACSRHLLVLKPLALLMMKMKIRLKPQCSVLLLMLPDLIIFDLVDVCSLCVTDNYCVCRYMEKFLQGAFGQVTYELIFFSVQESHYGTYKCHIANSKGYGVHQIRLASK